MENHGKPMVPRKIIYEYSVFSQYMVKFAGMYIAAAKHHPRLKHPLSFIAPLNAKKHI